MGGRDALLEDLFVVESARGPAWGARCSSDAVTEARERGCRRIELDVNDNNAAALALYRSLGFDNRDDRYGDVNLFMRLRPVGARSMRPQPTDARQRIAP